MATMLDLTQQLDKCAACGETYRRDLRDANRLCDYCRGEREQWREYIAAETVNGRRQWILILRGDTACTAFDLGRLLDLWRRAYRGLGTVQVTPPRVYDRDRREWLI